LIVAVGALKLLHHDVAGVVGEWIAPCALIRTTSTSSGSWNNWDSSTIVGSSKSTLVSFIYAALRLTEGVGLIFRSRWASISWLLPRAFHTAGDSRDYATG